MEHGTQTQGRHHRQMREDHGDGQTAAVDPGRARRGIERATPVQLDLMESRLVAEIASRERSKRVRLLKAAGFPNAKDIEGYDWSDLRMPADWGRVLGDKNMAAALIDRTVHHGRLIRFEGGSYRSEHALMTR